MPNQGCKEGMEILGAWCFIVGAACYMLGDFIEFMMLGLIGHGPGPPCWNWSCDGSSNYETSRPEFPVVCKFRRS